MLALRTTQAGRAVRWEVCKGLDGKRRDMRDPVKQHQDQTNGRLWVQGHEYSGKRVAVRGRSGASTCLNPQGVRHPHSASFRCFTLTTGALCVFHAGHRVAQSADVLTSRCQADDDPMTGDDFGWQRPSYQ